MEIPERGPDQKCTVSDADQNGNAERVRCYLHGRAGIRTGASAHEQNRQENRDDKRDQSADGDQHENQQAVTIRLCFKDIIVLWAGYLRMAGAHCILHGIRFEHVHIPDTFGHFARATPNGESYDRQKRWPIPAQSAVKANGLNGWVGERQAVLVLPWLILASANFEEMYLTENPHSSEMALMRSRRLFRRPAIVSCRTSASALLP